MSESGRHDRGAAWQAPGRPAVFLASLFLLSLGMEAHADPAKPARTAKAPKYGTYVRNWHTPSPGKTPAEDASGRPVLALFSLNTGDRLEMVAARDDGGFSAHDLDAAAFILREPSSGNEHPMEPRLFSALYRIQTHFHAEEVRVVSAYRTPHGGLSNHGQGRAVDLVIPGASDEAVAKFARELGFVGVGIYPHSGFVHVDVRDRSYFWVDGSGPGRRNRERGILGDLARKSDERALLRGERPLGPYAMGSDVDAALRLRAREPSSPPRVPEEDEDSDTP